MANSGFGSVSSNRAAVIRLIQIYGTGDIDGVTAGDGLSGGGTSGTVTVDADYSGTDSIVMDATDGTGITVDGSNDKLLLYDNDASAVKYVNVSQVTAGGVTPAGSNTQIQYNNGGSLGASAGLTYDGSTLTTTGDMKALGYTTYSSRRYKENIEPLNNSLETIKLLQGVSFNWKEGGKPDYGFIAEDAGQILPHAVKWEENGVDAVSMDYTKVIAFLVESVKQLSDEVEKLKEEKK